MDKTINGEDMWEHVLRVSASDPQHNGFYTCVVSSCTQPIPSAQLTTSLQLENVLRNASRISAGDWRSPSVQKLVTEPTERD